MYCVPASSVVSCTCEGIMYHQFLHFVPDGDLHDNLFLCSPKEKIKASPVNKALFDELVAIPYLDESFSASYRRKAIFNYLLSFFLDDNGQNEKMRKFVSVLRYIDDHIGEHITNKTLGKQMYLNEVYFSNLFTKTFGMSPITYINNRKISLAASLLSGTSLPVKEIAYKLGFENETYFTKLFKKLTSLSPLQFRSFCRST